MDDRPFDRACLDRLARQVGDLGPIGDMGYGPGQVARYLHRRGVPTLGVDLSANMVAEAQRLNPQMLSFSQLKWRAGANNLDIALMATLIREPDTEVEVHTQRAYILAKKPPEKQSG